MTLSFFSLFPLAYCRLSIFARYSSEYTLFFLLSVFVVSYTSSHLVSGVTYARFFGYF